MARRTKKQIAEDAAVEIRRQRAVKALKYVRTLRKMNYMNIKNARIAIAAWNEANKLAHSTTGVEQMWWVTLTWDIGYELHRLDGAYSNKPF